MDACTINKNVILSDLIKSIPIGCCVYRETLQHIEFVIWNKHMVDITGYTLEEINEVGWPNIFYDTYSINDFNKVGLDEDYKITSKDGTKKIINITTSSINTDEGRDSILALVKDITKYKHLEQELAEIEERYEKILRLSTDSILIHDSEKIIHVNNNTFEMLGIKNHDDIIGQPLYKYIEPRFHKIVQDRVKTQLETKGYVPIIEESLIDVNGNIVNVEVASSYAPYKGRKCAFTFIRNITSRKKLENKLKKSESMLRQVAENSLDMITISDINGVIQYGTPSNKDTLGYDLKDFVGLNVLDLVHPDELNYTKIQLEEMKENFQEKTIQCSLRCKDGNYKLLEIRGKALNDDGIIERFIFSSRDISERKKAEALEKDMKEKSRLLYEAAEYERLRTEFFANISHELRTPINVILSILQLLNLKTNNINETYCSQNGYNKYHEIMKQNCYRLIRLVNNLIDVTKIDSGYFSLNLINANIVNVVEDITQSVVDYTENKGITLTFDTDIEEKILACDPDKIERIILNLISNSVKFTESGGEILVKILDKGQNLVISVKDTGIGISKDKQKVIFERFVQVDKSLARNREGSGIGLSLVKSLVEMHDGTITVSSELNKGSEFIINLPCNLVNEPNDTDSSNHFIQGNLEKINIEFSDIYY